MNPGLRSYTKLVNTWKPLLIKRFRCGHEKTEQNTLINRHRQNGRNVETKRCRACHNKAGLDWMRRNRR